MQTVLNGQISTTAGRAFAVSVLIIVIHVQERIQKGKYHSIADMQEDVLLLCRNARTYNQEGSQIYLDSQVRTTTVASSFACTVCYQWMDLTSADFNQTQTHYMYNNTLPSQV